MDYKKIIEDTLKRYHIAENWNEISQSIVTEIQRATDLARIEEIEKWLDDKEFCKCDPIFSGEEYCNGGCELRKHLTKLKTEIGGGK